MMNEFFENLDCMEAICKKIAELPPTMERVLICQLIDITAVRNEMTSVELLDTIRPIIAEVNQELGEVEI